jgi:hypothetical protein
MCLHTLALSAGPTLWTLATTCLTDLCRYQPGIFGCGCSAGSVSAVTHASGLHASMMTLVLSTDIYVLCVCSRVVDLSRRDPSVRQSRFYALHRKHMYSSGVLP